MYYIIKVLLSAVTIVLVSEIAKRSTLFGALVASLPLTSILALVWLYLDTKNIEKVSALSQGIFWIFIPSLMFFISFPILLKYSLSFWISMGGAVALTACTYWLYIKILMRLGIDF